MVEHLREYHIWNNLSSCTQNAFVTVCKLTVCIQFDLIIVCNRNRIHGKRCPRPAILRCMILNIFENLIFVAIENAKKMRTRSHTINDEQSAKSKRYKKIPPTWNMIAGYCRWSILRLQRFLATQCMYKKSQTKRIIDFVILTRDRITCNAITKWTRIKIKNATRHRNDMIWILKALYDVRELCQVPKSDFRVQCNRKDEFAFEHVCVRTSRARSTYTHSHCQTCQHWIQWKFNLK